MSDGVDWVIIREGGKPIGALGLIDDTVAIIQPFFDDRDANQDGDVSIGERITFIMSPVSVRGMAAAHVAMVGRLDERVYLRDPDFDRAAKAMWLSFASGLVAQAAFVAWVQYSLQRATGALAPMLTSNVAGQYVIRKGMESAVKKAWNGTYHAR